MDSDQRLAGARLGASWLEEYALGFWQSRRSCRGVDEQGRVCGDREYSKLAASPGKDDAILEVLFLREKPEGSS